MLNTHNVLDKAYMVFNSSYLIDNDKNSYLHKIEKLAELGQINAIQDFYKLKPKVYQNLIIEGIVKDFSNCGKEEFEECLALFISSPNRSLADEVVKLANAEYGKVFFEDRFKAAVMSERILDAFQCMEEFGYPISFEIVKTFKEFRREAAVGLKEEDCTKDQALLLKYINAKNELRKKPTGLPVSKLKKHFINLLRISQLPISESENL